MKLEQCIKGTRCSWALTNFWKSPNKKITTAGQPRHGDVLPGVQTAVCRAVTARTPTADAVRAQEPFLALDDQIQITMGTS